MNTLKQHLSLLIPLITMAFSLQCLLILERTVAKQEQFITQKYAIGITAKKPINFESIQSKVVEAKELKELNPKDSISKLTKDINESNIIALTQQMPYFYSLSLEYFPNTQRLSEIESILKKNPNIIAVDTFSKRHLENYTLLSFIKFSVITFSVILAFISFMLMLKQIEIWRYVSRDKMEVMDILGASVWIRNRSLFKLALIDSFLASFSIAVLTFYISTLSFTNEILNSLSLSGSVFQIPLDFIRIFFACLMASILCVIFIILSKARR
ncbi:hypothetical protein DCO58_11620 [Helicobacter saguini]|uniref:Cell division protein FtsX n=1 Tax=Helicobacter saguini TaxID=1548018 RepID=A0A347VQ62_9HELI|nr:FtsX-like permease family protein [Helicobacter saguini]MWV61062.1 hypothetical protein [Helicobacter saguini]MWV68269.1 hypothetical protein [Helicobacter saguini]MWV70266.1 hypothetical protein [Helicobacter saguini]MWV72169.1 hypothetical protein [Helicobacter saguini]TLD95229.1 hypothetical protein LS64_002365 [Helicobacter saguini]